MTGFAAERILVLYNPLVQRATELAGEIRRWAGGSVPTLPVDDAAARDLVAAHDLVVALGGDGTMLRAGRLTAPHNGQVLGINFGRLGFLPEVQPPDWRQALERVMLGEGWAEARMLLRIEHVRLGDVLSTEDSLNEAVVGRGAQARMSRLQARINGDVLTTYVADGLICATPTGSTAYALAAGGPILPPENENILLVPIAPHMSMERTIVLPGNATLEVEPEIDDEHQASLSVDGQRETLLVRGDVVRATRSPFVARFVRLRAPHYFFATLVERLTNGRGSHAR
jgi:NAD+ kinase